MNSRQGAAFDAARVFRHVQSPFSRDNGVSFHGDAVKTWGVGMMVEPRGFEPLTS